MKEFVGLRAKTWACLMMTTIKKQKSVIKKRTYI